MRLFRRCTPVRATGHSAGISSRIMKVRILHGLKIVVALSIIIAGYAAVMLPAAWYYETIDRPVLISLVGVWVSVLTGVLALLKDFILHAINAPQLTIKFFPKDRRDCHATIFRNDKGDATAHAHYFRVRIENNGWESAENVEVTLEEVKQFQNGEFQIDEDFMPLRLFWSHWRERRWELSIPSGTYRHCDFGFVIDPNPQNSLIRGDENGKLLFFLDVYPRPNTGRTSLLPGRYLITLTANARNAKGARLTLDLDWKGIWKDDFNEFILASVVLR